MTYRSGVLIAMAALVLGCAKGGENTDGDGGDGAGAEGGMGGSMGGMGGAMGGMGGSGGGDPLCEDDPCKLVAPQCGCGDGDHCTVTIDGLRVCAPEGDRGPLEYCAPGQCQADHFCYNNGGTGIGGICHQFCEEDADCNTPLIGALCLYTPTGAKLCTQKCDLLSNTGCKELNPLLKCDIGIEMSTPLQFYTRCINAGSVPAQGDCSSGSCAAGTSCVQISGEPFPKCLPWCDVNGLACTVGTCVGLTVGAGMDPIVIDGITYGGCLL